MNIVPDLSRLERFNGKGKAALLRTLGFSKEMSYEDAHARIKECIVYARKLGNDGAASHFSEADRFLKKHLKHKCQACDTLVHPRSILCVPCARKIVHPRAYRPYEGHNGISPLVFDYLRSVSSAFFHEICYAVHQRKPHLQNTVISKSVYDALKHMRRRGMISGGEIKNWRRYEKNLSSPEWENVKGGDR